MSLKVLCCADFR